MTRTNKHGAKPGKVTSIQRKPKASTPAATLTTKPNQSVFDQLPDRAFVRESQPVQSPMQPESTVSAPADGLLTRIGIGIKKMAKVADDVDKIRNAIEGVYKLVGAIWPIFLLIWPN